MKIKQILLLIPFIAIYTTLSFGQDVNCPINKFEFGLKLFTYHGNLVAPKNYVDNFVPRYFNGGFIKFSKNKLQFRVGYDYFKYHIQYVLSDITEVADYDHAVDGIFNRHKLFFGMEKEILQSRIRPFIFADIGLYYSRYHGDFAQFSGWSLQTYYYKFNSNSMGLTLLCGPGVKLNLTKNLFLNYEIALNIDKNLIVKNDPHHMMRNCVIKFNPIHLLGISYKLN